MVELLYSYESDFLSLDNDNRKIFYYDKREKFNQHIQNRNDCNQLERASLFLFLNKTCFNGLYRVNKKGLFNVLEAKIILTILNIYYFVGCILPSKE